MTTNPSVLNSLTMIFKEMRFHGIGCVNYRRVGDDPSKLKLFELNPRVCGGLEESVPKYEDHFKDWIQLYAKNELKLMPRPAKEVRWRRKMGTETGR